MRTDEPKMIRLADYTAPDYRIETVDLEFDLVPDRTLVRARLNIKRDPAGEAGPMVLNGEDLELIEVSLDGAPLAPNRYEQDKVSLTLLDPPEEFQLETLVAINPAANTRLEGLYKTKTLFCTQCEAEGFRRITYFQDRPDVMATYRVSLKADKDTCPVLLSNGNNVETAELDDNRHMAVWEDPFPKPAYLFALVAGDLAEVADKFTTKSGREVSLKIFVDHGNETRCDYAMDALKRSMAWDETRFGLEYDLDIFNIVAVNDFNMGAMENKSLNIFNAKYVLADAKTATDQDFANIEAIVAHEYFHNWTGNRVTCRDWFQLSLKEGLTVFRDQEFTSDQRSRPVKRIQDVRNLRARQFPEDSGPLSHPIRPDSYIEINNFYTATVYEKGAEVIRMMHTLLGEDGFQKGMRLYFDRHDGEAVTCMDFVAAMEDASGVDLTQFRHWYSQAGTPEITVNSRHEPDENALYLTLEQNTRPTPGQDQKEDLHIPLRLGLLGANGGDIRVSGSGAPIGDDGLVHLINQKTELRLENVPERPVLSLNRGFSSPALIRSTVEESDLAFQMGHDSDAFARWEAGQQLATRLMLRQINARESGGTAPSEEILIGLIQAIRAIAEDAELDPAFKALACTLPSQEFIGDQLNIVPVETIHAVRQGLRLQIGTELRDIWENLYDQMQVEEPFEPSAAQAGKRALRNTALAYLTAAGDTEAANLAKQHYDRADNMTDMMAALGLLCNMESKLRDDALTHFEEMFGENESVMDKWFALQAMATRPGTLSVVQGLSQHRAFDIRNPNKVRSLVGAFAMGNPLHFHVLDGSGYRFLANSVIELDSLNPQVAARLLGPLGTWRRYNSERQALMKAELNRIINVPVLSPDSFEIATKSLGS